MQQLKTSKRQVPVVAASDSPVARVRRAASEVEAHLGFLNQLLTNLQLLERSFSQRGGDFSVAPGSDADENPQFTYVVSSDMALVLDILTRVFRSRFPAAAAAPEMLSVMDQPFGDGVRADIRVQRIEATNHVVLTLSDVHAAQLA